MSNTVAKIDSQPQRMISHGDSWWNDSAQFEHLQRVAKLFAGSPLVPKTYQGANGIGSCVIALNMATRMKADPLMVMQNLYIVHNRPSWSSQFLIACFNQTGRFSPIRYRWFNTQGKDDWGCQAYAKETETGEIIEGPVVTIKMAKDEGWYQRSGSKWQTIPQLMLTYRAASWLVRTHAPELAMGLSTKEESEDISPEKSESEFPDKPISRMSAIEAVFTSDSDASEPEMSPTTGANLTTPEVPKTRSRNAILKQIAAAKTVDAVNEIMSEIMADETVPAAICEELGLAAEARIGELEE